MSNKSLLLTICSIIAVLSLPSCTKRKHAPLTLEPITAQHTQTKNDINVALKALPKSHVPFAKKMYNNNIQLIQLCITNKSNDDYTLSPADIQAKLFTQKKFHQKMHFCKTHGLACAGLATVIGIGCVPAMCAIMLFTQSIYLTLPLTAAIALFPGSIGYGIIKSTKAHTKNKKLKKTVRNLILNPNENIIIPAQTSINKIIVVDTRSFEKNINLSLTNTKDNTMLNFICPC